MERDHVNQLVTQILADTSELQDRWHTEASAAAWSGSGDVYVTGGATSRPTETSALNPKPTDASRIVDTLEEVAGSLRRRLRLLRPRHVSSICNTDGCDGPATHDGRCWNCWAFRRRNRYDPPAKLVAQWNKQRPRDCECSDVCCPDGCWDTAAPDRTVSERCHKRMVRRRAQAS